MNEWVDWLKDYKWFEKRWINGWIVEEIVEWADGIKNRWMGYKIGGEED